MDPESLFGPDLRHRLQASGQLGLHLYGEPRGRFVGDDALARGFAHLSPLLPHERLSLVTDGAGNSYGAWNPTILFLGLAAGSRPPPRARPHQHGIGCPDFFEREPGAHGGIWLASTVKELAIDAFRELSTYHTFEWLTEWWVEAPGEFLAGTGGAAAVLNLSADAVRMGGVVRIDHSARELLLAWLRVFRPYVLVNLKPGVAETLLQMFPDCGLWEHAGTSPNDAARTSVARLADLQIPVVTMPLHPTAMGKGINRMRASKPRVSRAIAAVLATSAHPSSSE